MCSTFALASNRYFKQDEETQKEVSFFDITTWSRLAEVCEESLYEGRGVRVVGRLKQDRWTSPEAQAEAVKSMSMRRKNESAEPAFSYGYVTFPHGGSVHFCFLLPPLVAVIWGRTSKPKILVRQALRAGHYKRRTDQCLTVAAAGGAIRGELAEC